MDSSSMDVLIIIDLIQPETMNSNQIIKTHSMELNWNEFENIRNAQLLRLVKKRK